MPRKKTHEEFIAEVNSLVGDEYTVVGTYINARTKVEVRHNKCGNTWLPTAQNFIARSRCGHCYGTNNKNTKEFQEKVRIVTDGEYEFVGQYISARTPSMFIHRVCEESFSMRPNSFISRGHRCPKCAHEINGYKRRKTAEQFALDVVRILGDDYSLASEYSGSSREVVMHHKICNEFYTATANNVMGGKGCPICRESKGERRIAEWLSANQFTFERQWLIRYELDKPPLKLDFIVQGVAIEYDGEFHYLPMAHAGGNEGLRSQQARDRIKDKYCADNGIPLIRIPYWEFENIDAILTEKLLPLVKDRRV